MPTEFVTGDLLASELPAYAHGCNCAGAMGAGIALPFKRRWPEMYRTYRELCLSGRFQLGGTYTWWGERGDQELVTCLGTQQSCNSKAELPAIERSVHSMIWTLEDWRVEAVGLPQIGCGLGGLSWDDVKPILKELGDTTNIRLIVFEHYTPNVPFTL